MNLTKDEKFRIVRRIREQSIDITERMWKKPDIVYWIEKNLKWDMMLKPELKKMSKDELNAYVRREYQPEWCALIDEKYNLVLPRYGLQGVEFGKKMRCVMPQPYSIGFVHYHPMHVVIPSVGDISNWCYRYLKGERIFCIHTDYETICYFFSEGLKEEDFPREVTSIGFLMFGWPRSVRIKIHNWFGKMMREGYIDVVRVGYKF